MMSFHIRTEDFRPILPPDGVDLNTGVWRFVKYQGEIALVDDEKGLTYEPNGDAYLQTWVRLRYSFKDWEMKRILIAKWRTYAHDPPNEYGYYSHFRGTVGTGELVFAPIRVTEDGSLDVILYDTTTQTFRKSSKVQLLGGGHEDRSVETFLDHVDCPVPI
ncbi:F-box associated domain type 3 [Arabidopsis thaliana x Arabidopsis arenosa]|uniref:F-box associated domain type 3 n=1 Tax=Arabidopsis thaliana x Arabidopsis arenosa TaxID=1240361 RepID=A0A8T2BMQ5_9BRAS|nr:F-box associated domain type 3 [Arabidopsis thaliana x Arabidopsis arenosa]